MSGHNKWSKIKRKKGDSDIKKGKTFSKLAKIIQLAARKGADPQNNTELRMVIEQAKSVNMPSDNIERAIKKGSGEDRSVGSLEEVMYEAYGPGGVAILINTITDNKNRTVAEIKNILSKNAGTLAGGGSVKWLFKNKGQLTYPESAVELNEKDSDSLERLLGELENQEDVRGVFTNKKEV